MKKFILLLVLASVCVSTNFAQNISFRIETDQLFTRGGTNLNRSNADLGDFNVTVYGGTVSNLTVLQSAVDDYLNAGDKVTAASTLFNDDAFSADGWATISTSSGVGPFAGLDWSGTRNSLTEGNIPVLLVVTNSIGSLSSSDEIGLVAGNLGVTGSGTTTFGFTSGTGTARWTNTLIGTAGSLTLTAVPEPSAFAALAGFCALGWVMLRRRRG